jgi:hypothetical protein
MATTRWAGRAEGNNPICPDDDRLRLENQWPYESAPPWLALNLDIASAQTRPAPKNIIIKV